MSKPTVYHTPGRECAHADVGCCPSCYDPAMLLKSTREFVRKVRDARIRTTTTQKEN